MAALKLSHCCCCIELRIGCIVLAIVGIILSIIGVALNPYWISIIGLVVSIIANGCLLYAALHTTGTTTARSVATLIYVVLCLIDALVFLIAAIMLCIGWAAGGDDWSSDQHAILATATVIYFITIGIYLYFALVAFSFYQQLKGEGSNDRGYA